MHQLQSKEDKYINTATSDWYFKGYGIRQQVKIICCNDAGKHYGDSLNMSLYPTFLFDSRMPISKRIG